MLSAPSPAYSTAQVARREADAPIVEARPADSVASFFVSRVGTEVDKRLDALATEEATDMKSKAARG